MVGKSTSGRPAISCSCGLGAADVPQIASMEGRELKVLVTGGAGFIGSNLCRTMLMNESITEVRVLDDLSTGYRANLDGLNIHLVEGTFLDRDVLDSVVDGVDSIVHLGAIPSVPRSIADPVASHAANSTGTLYVMESARKYGTPHVVVASSSSVYGANPALPKGEDAWTRPLSPYGVSKHATEGYALAYHTSYGMNTLAFRFFNVYGPGQSAGHAYAAVIPRFIDAALKGLPLEVHGDGLQSRDFTFVRTVCDVITDAVIRKVGSSAPVNLAFGTNTTLLELIACLEEMLGSSCGRRHVSDRAGDVRQSQADGIRIRELFPSITPTGLRDGLQATMDWFREDANENEDEQ